MCSGELAGGRLTIACELRPRRLRRAHPGAGAGRQEHTQGDRDFTVRDRSGGPILSRMPVTEERIDALERDVAEIRGQVFEIRTTQTLHTTALGQCKEQMTILRTGQHQLRKGQEELRAGQDELRAGVEELRAGHAELRAETAELRKGQEELRAITDDLRKGQDELRTGMEELRATTAELRTGVEELRATTAELRAGQDDIRETLDGFRAAFAAVLDEIGQQKAWREEFSDKLARVIAKSEGLNA